MNQIYIYAAGGFGMEVAWLVEDINKRANIYDIKGFLDDDESKWGKTYYGYTVRGDAQILRDMDPRPMVAVAVGDPGSRRNLVSRLLEFDVTFPTLIHPSVIMSRTVIMEEGCIVAAGSILTVEIKIGKHVHINLNSNLGHESSIGDYSTINPSVSISGNCHIKENSYIGTGAQIIQGIEIGEGAIIGAGAVVVRDIPPGVVAVGSPARIIKKVQKPST
jgi:sugar O-acyltransferase (sialic acid O-acetyltransferase NeuD family)